MDILPQAPIFEGEGKGLFFIKNKLSLQKLNKNAKDSVKIARDLTAANARFKNSYKFKSVLLYTLLSGETPKTEWQNSLELTDVTRLYKLYLAQDP